MKIAKPQQLGKIDMSKVEQKQICEFYWQNYQIEKECESETKSNKDRNQEGEMELEQ